MHRTLATLLVALAFAFAAAQTDHQVQMMTLPIEGEEIPAFFFEPIGLHVQPGDTVTFLAAGPHHGVTAYHGQHVKSHRVPDGVEPFSSPIVPVGGSWSMTFTVPGTYDVWCPPHEPYGMAMRIIVGEPGGPANEPVTDFGPDGVFDLAGVVLNSPLLDPDRIVAEGSVSWYEIDPSKTVSTEGAAH